MHSLLISLVWVAVMLQNIQAQLPNTAQKTETEKSTTIELRCKLDTGADVRYTIDIEKKLLNLTLLLKDGDSSGLPITITDREFRMELRSVDGERLVSYIAIDRFTLEIRQYSGLFKEFSKEKDGWSRGQCEVLKRLL